MGASYIFHYVLYNCHAIYIAAKLIRFTPRENVKGENEDIYSAHYYLAPGMHGNQM